MSLSGCNWAVVLQFCQRVRLGDKYRFAICIRSYFGKMAESNNFKIKEEKAIHGRISHLCTWGRAGGRVAPCNTLGQHQGCREKQHKALQKLGDCIECSGWHLAPVTQSTPPNHSSFPSLMPNWNFMTAERRKRMTYSDSNINCMSKTRLIQRFPAEGKSYTHEELGERGARS